MALDNAWFLLKAGPMPSYSSTDRGYAEDPQFDNPIDRPEDYPDEQPDEQPEEEERAPIDPATLDSNQVMRMSGAELRNLIAQVQGEIDRRADKRESEGKGKVRVRL